MSGRIEDLAALHAAGALDSAGVSELTDLLAAMGREEIGEMAELHRAAAQLAELPRLSPPPEIRQSLFKSIDISVSGDFSVVRSGSGQWRSAGVAGVWSRKLSGTEGRVTFLLRMEPGSSVPHHDHTGPEDCFVVEGAVEIASEAYAAGDFIHASAGSAHGPVVSRSGCTLLLTVDAKDYAH